MALQLPGPINRLSLPNIDRARQATEMNELNIDAMKQGATDDQQMRLVKFGLGLSKVGLEGLKSDPNWYRRMYPKIVQQAQSLGMSLDEIPPADTPPDEVARSFLEIQQAMQMSPYGQPSDLTGQRNVATNEYNPIGASAKGPTAPWQNYEKRMELVAKFGENSPQVKTFDSYVRSPAYQTIQQMPHRMTPAGDAEPLSTLEAETEAAAEMAMAEGEGARGRIKGPTGEFEPVPGTQADIDQKAREAKLFAGSFMKSIQAQTVLEDVGRLNALIDAGQVPFGRQAKTTSRLAPEAQTDGYRNAVSLIESVKGNIGIDSLIRIKMTGAGLGHIPQAQLDLLSRLLGELDMTQEKEQFVYTWNRMGKIYEVVRQQADVDMKSLGVMPPEIYTPIQNEELALQQARDAIASGRSRNAVIWMLEGMGIDSTKL
jgi:hypothetical protein